MLEKFFCNNCKEKISYSWGLNIHESIDKDLICMKLDGMTEDECVDILKKIELYQTLTQYSLKLLQDNGILDSFRTYEKIHYALDSADGCDWLALSNKVQKRQFETHLKNYFEEFEQELNLLALNNKPLRDGKPEPYSDIGMHTMDDFGFEGQVMSSGKYWRIVYDSIETSRLKENGYDWRGKD